MAVTRANGIEWIQVTSDGAVTLKTAEEVTLAGTAAHTVTLPTASGIRGKRFVIENTDTVQITVATTSSQTIGEYAQTSFVLATKGELLCVISDGSNWKILFWEMPEMSGVVQTTDATVTTAFSFTPPDGVTTMVRARIAARRSTGAEGAGYELAATFRRTGATVTQIGATTVIASHEDIAGWDATLDTDATVIRARVTGVAAVTINWYTHVSVIEVA